MALLGNLTGSSHFFNPNRFYNDIATTSLRFGANNVLTNEQDAPSDRKNFTLSMWFKRNRTSTEEALAGGTTDNANYIRFESSGAIRVRQYNTTVNLITNALFRDTSAWYHLVVAWDLDNSTQADRVIIYVNGTRQTLATNTLPSNTSTDSNFNVDGGTLHIGAWYSGGVVGYYSGYIADVNFVDGTTLAPTAFGETKNGVWIPKNPTGLTYGNNGFRLQFKNSAVTTASSSTIGADTSGKNRHFTSAGIVASDCAMPDSPENNFSTMNPLHFRASYGMATLSEGNLAYGDAGLTTSWGAQFSTFNLNSGKWYAEVLTKGNSFCSIGVMNVGHYGYQHFLVQNPQDETGNWTLLMDNGETVSYLNGSRADPTYTAFNNDQVLGIALNADDKELSFYVDGTLQTGLGSSGVIDISTGGSSNDAWSFTANTANGAGVTFVWNFGQDSSFAGDETATSNSDANGNGTFHTAPPSGFLALCTANLPEPTIGPNSGINNQSDDHFNTVLYSGTGSSQAITGVGFQPDWVWTKGRSVAYSNYLFDSSRGVQKRLMANSTNAEDTLSNGLTVFGTDGFTHGGEAGMGNNGDTFVAWNWKANGGTTTTNDASSTGVGSIDSVIQANTTAGFSIVQYEATGSAGTIAHGLSQAPTFMIVKSRDQNGTGWMVYYGDNTDYVTLNGNGATIDGESTWNDTSPTSTVFSVGVNGGDTNNSSGGSMIGYIFHDVEGYSKFGSFIGNGNADGTFIYTGFRPAWIMFKATVGGDWFIIDATRSPINEADDRLDANESNAEKTSNADIDFLSNGVKIREASANGINQNTDLHIYMAFAEAPFKYANAR